MGQARAVTARIQEEMFGDAIPTKVAASGASYAPDITTAEVHSIVMTAALTIAAPLGMTAMQPGARFALILIQDNTGGRTLTWNSAWRNAPSGLGSGAAPGSRATFEFRYDGVSMQYTGGSTGFA